LLFKTLVMYHCSFQVKPQILDHDFSVCQKKQFRKYVNTFEFEVLCLVRTGNSSAGAHLLHLPYTQCQDQARGSSQPNVCLPVRQQSTKSYLLLGIRVLNVYLSLGNRALNVYIPVPLGN
jgi:hypothetical protein